jgi:putative tryptophan/tyrosine transport system substrate-binding protein
MRRREFIAGLAGSASWPLIAQAQQSARMYRIGLLIAGSETDPEAQRRLSAFRNELRRLGWTDGRDAQIETRWVAPGDVPSSQRFARELIDQKCDLIITSTTPPTAAVLQQTRTIPIIFVSVNDPVASGFVQSFPRPGGNATGFIILESSIGGKWLQVLKEVAPLTERAAFLFNPAQAPTAEYYLGSFKSAAESLGMQATDVPVRDKASIEPAISALAREPNSGFIVIPDAFLAANRAEITSLAARHKLPAVYYARLFPDAGGLLSYGSDLADSWRRAAGYVDDILKGAKPSELPVQGPTKFELVINLKTAKNLSLDISPSLLARAEEVIE